LENSLDNLDEPQELPKSLNVSSIFLQYFTAHIYEFQFYKALCQVSGQYEQGSPEKPLHQCNFYGKRQITLRLAFMIANLKI
jgi:hypothetical protein